MNSLLSIDVTASIIVVFKISLMIFTVLHLFFLMYIIKQIHGMKKQLSTFNQIVVEGWGVIHIVLLILLIIYFIFLPQ